MKILIKSLNETAKLAQDLVRQTTPPTTLALHGELGTGKTTFTQHFAQALGITQPIKSPTYTIIRQYQLPQTIDQFFHLDLYRIESATDLEALHLEEILNDQHNIIVIEWPEKIQRILPPHTTHLYFKTINDTTREITINNLDRI